MDIKQIVDEVIKRRNYETESMIAIYLKAHPKEKIEDLCLVEQKLENSIVWRIEHKAQMPPVTIPPEEE